MKEIELRMLITLTGRDLVPLAFFHINYGFNIHASKRDSQLIISLLLKPITCNINRYVFQHKGVVRYLLRSNKPDLAKYL